MQPFFPEGSEALCDTAALEPAHHGAGDFFVLGAEFVHFIHNPPDLEFSSVAWA